jgi:hypothetical protein
MSYCLMLICPICGSDMSQGVKSARSYYIIRRNIDMPPYPISFEDIPSIAYGLGLKSTDYRITGRLESLDVFLQYPHVEPAPLWILYSPSLPILMASFPGLLQGSGVIGASICGRLRILHPVIRTYILSSQPNGSLPLTILFYGGRGTVQILIDQESILRLTALSKTSRNMCPNTLGKVCPTHVGWRSCTSQGAANGGGPGDLPAPLVYRPDIL